MGKSVTKRVRMSPERARRLAEMAKATGKAEDDLLLEGMDLLEKRARRRVAVEELIAMAQGPEPSKARFTLRP